MGLRCVCAGVFSCRRALAHWHISTLTHCGLRPLRSPHKKMYHFTPKKCKFVFLSKRNDDLSKGFRVKKTFFAANLLNES